MEQPALQILNDNRIMSIATVRPDGWPQSTIVGYANEGWRLYFLIYRTSHKFQNISADDRISVSIGHEPKALREVKAVYAGCHAREITDTKEKEWMRGSCLPSDTRTSPTLPRLAKTRFDHGCRVPPHLNARLQSPTWAHGIPDD